MSNQDTAKINTAYAEYSSYFHIGSVQENIRNSKEEQFQEGFLRELFVSILGYTLNPTPNFNLTTAYKNVKDSKKADGAILNLVNQAPLEKPSKKLQDWSLLSYADFIKELAKKKVKLSLYYFFLNLLSFFREQHRIVFNIAISNTDDHLRNHGFILTNEGWILSPAYNLNPSIDKDGLSLNIDMDNNELDFDLAKSVGEYFRLDNKQMDAIIEEVKSAVSRWEEVANKIGISRSEQQLMRKAFK